MGIRRRILLSFFALFVVVFVGMTVLSTVLIGSAVEHRLQEQTDRHARFIATHTFMLRNTGLDYIKEFTGAQAVRDDAPGAPAKGDYVFRSRLGPEHELIMTYKADVVLAEKRNAILPLASVAALGLALVLVLGLLTART